MPAMVASRQPSRSLNHPHCVSRRTVTAPHPFPCLWLHFLRIVKIHLQPQPNTHPATAKTRSTGPSSAQHGLRPLNSRHSLPLTRPHQGQAQLHQGQAKASPHTLNRRPPAIASGPATPPSNNQQPQQPQQQTQTLRPHHGQSRPHHSLTTARHRLTRSLPAGCILSGLPHLTQPNPTNTQPTPPNTQHSPVLLIQHSPQYIT